jgi:inner membrane protein
VRSILRSSKMSLFVGCLLALQYVFIFTLIQLQDYALLMGSIGLFITLAVVMYFSRKIKWS